MLPPTGISFFIRLKQLKRHSCSPLLFTLRLKSTSSQVYLQIERKKEQQHNSRVHKPANGRPSPDSPIEVILDVLRQVDVEHDKVVEVASTEGLAVGAAGYAAVPLSNPAHRILGDFGRVFHVLQHHFQRHVGESRVAVRRPSERRTKFISPPNQPCELACKPDKSEGGGLPDVC